MDIHGISLDVYTWYIRGISWYIHGYSQNSETRFRGRPVLLVSFNAHTHVYGDFAAVFYPDKDNQLLNERCNIFYGMNIPVIEPLPNDCSEKERDAFKLKNFLIQLYGKSIEIDKIDSNTTFAADSSIIKAIENSTSKSAWGTERDAFLLNEALGEKVDVNIYSNQAPPHRPSKKLNSIHLNNENNVHWTTLSFLSPPKKYAVDSASTLIIKP